jgi:hypothetical protein
MARADEAPAAATLASDDGLFSCVYLGRAPMHAAMYHRFNLAVVPGASFIGAEVSRALVG